MSSLARYGNRLYAALLRLYPRAFRDEFAEEMQAEFAEALAEAGASGAGAIAVALARELRDLPGAVLRQQLRARNKKQLTLTLLLLLSLTIAGWVLVTGFLGFGILSSPVTWLIAFWLFWLLGFGLAVLARRLSAGAWITAAVIVLATFLVMPTSTSIEFEQNLPPGLPQALEYPLEFAVFFMPSFALIVVALLLYSGMTLDKAPSNHASPADAAWGKQAPTVSAVALALGTLLLLVTLYNLYWVLVWDSTYDPIHVLLLIFPVFAALSSGLFLLIGLRGKSKYAGLVYALLIPVLIGAVFVSARRVDYRQLTEERAGQLSQAVERYYAREGHYPENLQQLIPWYFLSPPGPVIINRQDWCYDAGPFYYRLGYADREHWSSPNFTGHVYKTQGAVPALEPICARELAVLQKRFSEIYR